MKKYILLIISLINIAVTGVFIAFNPNEELPSHYNVNGIADAYSSKWMLLFIPSILVLFSIIYAIYAKVKENDENYKSYSENQEKHLGISKQAWDKITKIAYYGYGYKNCPRFYSAIISMDGIILNTLFLKKD